MVNVGGALTLSGRVKHLASSYQTSQVSDFPFITQGLNYSRLLIPI